MPITFAEVGRVEDLRRRVLDELARRKAADPSLRVIDVGGAYNPWADAYVDAYVDLYPVDTDKTVFCGDICRPQVWEEIRRRGERFDFSICTHVLEDIRDPLFVVERLMEISDAGYVATPTKHSEMSNVESDYYLGYCHHRWVYTARREEEELRLMALAKYPVVGYFNSRWRPLLKLIHLLGRPVIAAKAQRRLGIFPAGGGIDWVDRRWVGHHTELGVRWEGDLPFRFVNGDYSGHTCLEAADLFRHSLRDGV